MIERQRKWAGVWVSERERGKREGGREGEREGELGEGVYRPP